MKCDEVQRLRDVYLDSELEAGPTLEIQRHLETCANCARRFAEEDRFEAALKASLSQGPRTARLWEGIERSVAGADTHSAPSRSERPVESMVSVTTLWEAVLTRLLAGWRRSPRIWTALAGTWVVILALNLTAREPGRPVTAQLKVPSPAEIRLALKQRQMLMSELAVGPEPAPAEKPKPTPPGPRSARANETVNV